MTGGLRLLDSHSCFQSVQSYGKGGADLKYIQSQELLQAAPRVGKEGTK